MYSTRIAVFTNASSVLTVNSGNPIWLHDIVVANATGSAITQSFDWSAGGVTVNPVLSVIANDTNAYGNIDAQVQSLALTAAPDSGVTVTILYREDG